MPSGPDSVGKNDVDADVVAGGSDVGSCVDDIDGAAIRAAGAVAMAAEPLPDVLFTLGTRALMRDIELQPHWEQQYPEFEGYVAALRAKIERKAREMEMNAGIDVARLMASNVSKDWLQGTTGVTTSGYKCVPTMCIPIDCACA